MSRENQPLITSDGDHSSLSDVTCSKHAIVCTLFIMQQVALFTVSTQTLFTFTESHCGVVIKFWAAILNFAVCLIFSPSRLMQPWKMWVLMFFPSLSYVFIIMTMMTSSKYLGASLYSVLSQVQMLSVCFFSILWLKRTVTSKQLASVCIISLGIIPVDMAIFDSFLDFFPTSSSTIYICGMLFAMTLRGCVYVGMQSLYDDTQTMWDRSVQFNMITAILYGIVVYFTECDVTIGSSISIVRIVTSSVGDILLMMILCFSGAIEGVICMNFSDCFIMIIASCLSPLKHISLATVCSALSVACGVLLFYAKSVSVSPLDESK